MMLALATAILASAASAGAPSAGYVRDPVDTAGPFDIAAASARERKPKGRRKARVLVLRIRTHAGWDPGAIARAPGGIAPDFLSFELDMKRERLGTRCLDIEVGRGGTLTGQLKPSCFPFPAFRTGPAVRIRHPRPEVVEAFLPVRLIARRTLRRYRWRATSSFEASGSPTCAPPQIPPPERRYGSCQDVTSWAKTRGYR